MTLSPLDLTLIAVTVAATSLSAGRVIARVRAWFAERFAPKNDELAIAIARLREVLEINNENGVDATKLLAGTLKACEAIAEATTLLRDQVAAFSDLIVGGKSDRDYIISGKSDRDYVVPPADRHIHIQDTEYADPTGAHSFMDAILSGMPADQAARQAFEAEEKKTMLSAVSMGPE